MIVVGKHLSRRTLLRGLGAAIGLPLLDGMVPAFAAPQKSAAGPVRRFAVVYVPNGIVMSDWTPTAQGEGLELSPILKPLAAFRDQMVVLTGLRNGPPHYAVHGAASTRFLTTVPPEPTTGSAVGAGISIDQLAAAALGRDTPLSSLELTLESGFAGACDIGSSCVYTDTIAWRGPTTPLPMEHNPRVVFERLFGESDTTERQAWLTRAGDERSILDSVTASISDLQRTLGRGDRAKVDEFLEAVRGVERRIQQTEARGTRDLPGLERPVGIPGSFPEHARMMFDLQVLAFQADQTRVSTFMMGRELSGRSFPEIGVHEAHHPTSHHQKNPEKIATLVKIDTHYATQFAYLLERLRTTPDGEGSLLDHSTIVYGCGMSDGDSHSPDNLPILLAGGGAGQFKGGRHLRFPSDTPVANLHMTLLEKIGVPVDHFGNSSGRLAGV